jgi:hypothetical protein
MTIHDEHDFRAQLGTALDEFAPGPVPFEAVVRQGKAVVIRKRVTVIAASLAVLAAAALVPTVLHALRRPPPVTPHYHVTVTPPPPGSPRGLVATGLVNQARWQFFARHNEHPDEFCLESRLGTGACGSPGTPPGGRAGAPATLSGDPQVARLPGGRWVRVQMVHGFVRHDVDHLRVGLSNGQVLTLRPVDLFGGKYARWVAFAVPFAAAVSEIRVYSASAELEHAVPFTGRGSIEIKRWLKPGQPDLPRPVAGRLGSGMVEGHHFVVRGYLGPWGICFRNAPFAPYCSNQSGPLQPGTIVKNLQTAYVSQQHIGMSVLQVDPTVSYLLVTRVKGSVLRLSTKTLGPLKYCILPLDLRNRGVTWTAFDRAGHLLGSGSVTKLAG